MKEFLIAGLGNVGPAYELTRHNVGFLVLDRLADVHKSTFQTDRLADLAEVRYKGHKLHLIKPSTYMNLSGKAVRYWMNEFNLRKEHVLVVVDDLALPFGNLRMRRQGSSAGHNGLKNIEELLEGQDFARLRVGIGNSFSKGQQVDFVLSRFTDEEFKQLPEILDKASAMILDFCTMGIDRAMSQHND